MKNIVKLIEKANDCIEDRYDLSVRNMNEIYQSSSDAYDMICNGFRFGYMQGLKAAEARMRKQEVC